MTDTLAKLPFGVPKLSQSFELLIILLLGFTPMLWFEPETIVFGHDTVFSLNPGDAVVDKLFAWTQGTGFGRDQGETLWPGVGMIPIHGLEILVGRLGMSLTGIQQITFSFWLMSTGLSMYALLHYLDGRSEAWMFRMTGTFLYMINHFLLQAWVSAARTQLSLIVALPLVVLIVLSVVDRRIGPVKGGILIGLTVGVFNGGGFVNLYAAVLLTSSLAILFFGLLEIRERGISGFQHISKFTLVAVASFVLINAY